METRYYRGSRDTPRKVYDRVLEDLHRRVGECKLIMVWSLDPVRNQLILRSAGKLPMADVDVPVLECYRSFSGEAVEAKTISDFPDIPRSIAADSRPFDNPRLIRDYGLRRLVCIPIFNTVNINQVLSVINIFPAEGGTVPDQSELERIAEGLAYDIENCVRDHCIRHANRVDIELRKVKVPGREAYCQVLARLVRSALGCDEVSVYIEASDRKSVDFQASDGLPRPPAAGAPATGKVKECWETNREILDNQVWRRRAGPPPPSAAAAAAEAAPQPATAFVPLRDMKGQAKGIVACAHRIEAESRQPFRPFTYDDVAVVEAICQAFAPQTELLLAEQKRVVRLTKLAHELRVPIVAFKAALHRLRKESREKRWVYQYDYLENIASYSEVMARLLKELEVLRIGPERIVLSASRPVLLNAAVIAPAVRFIRPELTQRNFHRDQIQKIEGLEMIPALYVDPALMTQVVFNLLLNAIKYFGEKRSPAEFWLKIEGRKVKTGFEISFKDLGIGVPPGFEDAIFEHGVRAPNAQFDQTGDGLGLWIARELVERHGGRILLRQSRGPTEFVIWLPDSLEMYPPSTPS